jgi:hypothetical protein
LRPRASQASAAVAGTSAAATGVTVPLDLALAKLFQHHSDGDTVASVQIAHVQRLWGGMGAVLEVRVGLPAVAYICRFVLPLIHFILDSLTYSVPLFLNRQFATAP